MATLQKIRTHGGVFIAIIVGIALLSFIIDPQTLQQATMMFSSENDVGKIAGKSISIRDFEQRVEARIKMFQEARKTSRDRKSVV